MKRERKKVDVKHNVFYRGSVIVFRADFNKFLCKNDKGDIGIILEAVKDCGFSIWNARTKKIVNGVSPEILCKY